VELTFLGTSSGVPTRGRNVSSIGLKLPQRAEVWLFDCGEGTQHQLLRSELKTSQIRRIFITHMHGDHIFGLMGLLASCGLAGDNHQVDVYGPADLQGYIKACLRYSQMRFGFPVQVHPVAPGLVYEDAEFQVTCAPLKHRVPAFGYRVAERERAGEFNVASPRAGVRTVETGRNGDFAGRAGVGWSGVLWPTATRSVFCVLHGYDLLRTGGGLGARGRCIGA